MTKYDLNIREESIKLKVAKDWFGNYDTTQIKGNIDFSVCVPSEPGQLELFDLDFFLWAEAKKGNKEDIDDSLVQLIITIMKARTFNDYLPPLYLGAFDAEKIAFIPYDDKLQRQVIYDQVLENKIDWTRITPSDHTTEEFALVKKKAKDVLLGKIVFNFAQEEKELKRFIKSNFVVAKTGTNKINITLNRMTSIFNRWLEDVKPTINVPWADLAKEYKIEPADFFLADVISKNNQSLGDSLQVLLRSNVYHVTKQTMFLGSAQKALIGEVKFKDNQKAHKTFWNKYNRPPRRKERLQMQTRRDLLIEPDRREREGAYFTPHLWVDLSREYLTNILGNNWQEEYYVWDCCAGTGNLLFGLTEKERIFASTDQDADVTYMKTQDNLLPAHVFQFDFLNDDLNGDKVPDDLKRIIKNPEERKKLVIYINPPYGEAGSTYGKKAKIGVSNLTKVHKDFAEDCGAYAKRELFVQFFMRIYIQIPDCILAEFSKIKILQAPYFRDFRRKFSAKLESGFIVPADTFDNIKKKFPIGFFIWDLSKPGYFTQAEVDTYNKNGDFIGKKYLSSYENSLMLNDWLRPHWVNVTNPMGYLVCNGNDFVHQNEIVIVRKKSNETSTFFKPISQKSILQFIIYLSVRHCIEATWINDRDQFLYPRKAWKNDREFHHDCLAYALFHGQNRITSAEGINHWIPFKEKEVNAPMLFESHFMSDFIAGKIKPQAEETLFGEEESLIPTEPIIFSPEAQAVMDAGRELWIYYMTKTDDVKFNVNASYYDIRRYFQGVNDKGTMNTDSKDEKYMRLWGNIKDAQKVLAKKIEPKVYLYGFLLDETTLPADEPVEVVENPQSKPAKVAKPKIKKATKNQMVVNNYGTLNYYEK